jgi:hypothetical protein
MEGTRTHTREELTGILAFSHLEDECGVGGMVIM